MEFQHFKSKPGKPGKSKFVVESCENQINVREKLNYIIK